MPRTRAVRAGTLAKIAASPATIARRTASYTDNILCPRVHTRDGGADILRLPSASRKSEIEDPRQHNRFPQNVLAERGACVRLFSLRLAPAALDESRFPQLSSHRYANAAENALVQQQRLDPRAGARKSCPRNSSLLTSSGSAPNPVSSSQAMLSSGRRCVRNAAHRIAQFAPSSRRMHTCVCFSRGCPPDSARSGRVIPRCTSSVRRRRISICGSAPFSFSRQPRSMNLPVTLNASILRPGRCCSSATGSSMNLSSRA